MVPNKVDKKKCGSQKSLSQRLFNTKNKSDKQYVYFLSKTMVFEGQSLANKISDPTNIVKYFSEIILKNYCENHKF